MNRYLKYCFIILSLILSLTKASIAQDFYKDYKRFLIKSDNHKSRHQKADIDSTIIRLQKVTDRYQKVNKRSFFQTDTIFIIHLRNAENGFTRHYIWNRQAACYYRYEFEMKNWKILKSILVVNTNAQAEIDSFNKEFIKIIETGDTTGYLHYTEKHWVLDGSWVSPYIAIRENGRWRFALFEGNGHAVYF